MDISLTPELEKIVKKKVDSGLYNSASEVICEALRVAAKVESDNDWLKREAAIGFAQLEAGELARVTTKTSFWRWLERTNDAGVHAGGNCGP